MRPLTVLALLSAPVLIRSQSSGSGNVQVSTQLSTSVGIDGNHQQTTQVITNLITLTSSASASAPSNSTASNSTNSGNATSSGNSTTSSSRSPLPTATQSADGGGNGPNGAPSPGASSNSGIYGPDDGFISSAFALRATSIISVAAGVIGGICLVWT